MNKVSIIMLIMLMNIMLTAQTKRPGTYGSGRPAGAILKGRVEDSSNKRPVEFANVSLYASNDSSVVNGTVTDAKGSFMIRGIKPGKYYAKVSFIGYKTVTVPGINIAGEQDIKDLKELAIEPSSIKLKSIVVRADKDMIVTNLDKQVINVEKDLSSAGGTALDVMQNIPALTVDIDGNVSLRGNSNVTILVDGKPTGLSGISSSDVLTSIPASSIKAVELVTNPSAKYDPDGTAGIINIVLKKRSNLGLNGIINLNAGSGDKYNGGTNFNYRTGDINFYGNIDGRLFRFNRLGTSQRTNDFENQVSYLNQNSSSVYNMNMGDLQLGTDFLLDDYNTISLSGQYRRFRMNNTGVINNYMLDNPASLSDYFANNSTGDRNVKSLEYTLSYKRDYDEKGKKLTADVIYTNNSMTSFQTTGYNYFLTNGAPSQEPASLINNSSVNSRRNLIIQSDFTQPLGEHSSFEAGYKSSFSNLEMDYDYYNFNATDQQWIPDPARINNYNYKEQIHALYGIYTGGIGSLKFQGGLRGEYALTNSDLLLANVSYDKNYFSLYPSVYLTYDFNPLQEFKVSYSRRVDRPRPWQINPFVNYADSLNLTYGNPNLNPEYTNSYEMGYSTIFFDFNIYSSLFYKQTSGLITQISTLKGNGVTESTFENIASEKNYGAEMVANGSFFKWWRLNANVSYFRADINDPNYVSGFTNYSYSWTSRINSTWMLDKTLSIQISSTYNSPIVRAQGKMNAIYFTDFALKKEFMNGDLAVTLRLSDIFNTRKFNSETYGSGFTQFSQGQRDSRILFLGITYNLNNYKQSKDRGKPINIDDGLEND